MSYQYRADGMRVKKAYFVQDADYQTRYRYDGQMGIEDVETTSGAVGSTVDVTRYGLGARGIDYMEYVTGWTNSGGGTTSVAFPVYDGHGNMVACLSRSGQNSFSLTNQRSMDAWGNVRLGVSTGDPKGRYCANIGHKQDDESGLIYMRARYYEPTSGRFVSQDPGMQGVNWFTYCGNDPVNRVDTTGMFWEEAMAFAMGFLIAATIAYAKTWDTGKACLAGLVSGISCAVISSVSNYIGKAALAGSLSTAWACVARVTVGTACNIAASFLISLITEDDFGLLDIILSGVSGGLGGGLTGQLGFTDDIVMSMLGNSVPSAGSGIWEFMKS